MKVTALVLLALVATTAQARDLSARATLTPGSGDASETTNADQVEASLDADGCYSLAKIESGRSVRLEFKGAILPSAGFLVSRLHAASVPELSNETLYHYNGVGDESVRLSPSANGKTLEGIAVLNPNTVASIQLKGGVVCGLNVNTNVLNDGQLGLGSYLLGADDVSLGISI